jgi:hypothetical protein
MAISIEVIIEKALEEAFARALDSAIQANAEAIFAWQRCHPRPRRVVFRRS